MSISLALGLAVGLILALTGAGGGILAVPLLVFGTHVGVAQAGPIGLMAVGMAAALGATLGLRAGVVRYRAALLVAGAGMVSSPAGVAASAAGGTLAWSIALPFSAGALAGMLGGRALSARLSGPHLQHAFAALSAVVALGMIARAL